ncbi:MAG: efflux RND transporter periplasmic adaptor subunit [Candidatus Binataceae bacterium]|jgi:Cu(I)/Ag(I) efflux system membrane fusion protein
MKLTGCLGLAIVALLMAFVVASCESSSASRVEVETTEVVPQLVRQADGVELMKLRPADLPGMTLATVKQVELPGVLETSGQVTFDDRRVSKIISRVAGRIENGWVSQWDYVQRGERILALYSPDYMTAEAEYLQAVETSRVSATSGLPDEARVAKALLTAARRKLELLGLEQRDIDAIQTANPTFEMRAPISGSVVEKLALRGSQVNPGDVLFSLGTLEQVWITADIYEDDLARIRVGQQLEAVTTAFPDEVFKGTVSHISPSIDPTTHTLTLRCEVRNPGSKLKPQMLARVRIVTNPGSALVVPQESLVFDTDGYYAFVQVGEDHWDRRRVSITSWNEQGYARVVGGLKGGERVVRDESIQMNALWHQAHGEGS